MRALVTLLAMALPAAAQQAVDPLAVSTITIDEQKQLEIRIGVRDSARPFSYVTRLSPGIPAPKFGPLRAGGYDGYMVYICDEVLKQMMLSPTGTQTLGANQVKIVPIDQEMESRGGEDRTDLLGEEIDILCDPATIDRERVRRYAVSLPLFTTSVGFLRFGGGLAYSRCNNDTGKALIGAVGATNAVTYGVKAILDQGEWKEPKMHEDVVKALQRPDGGTEDCPHITGKVSGIIWTGATHDQVAHQFCQGNLFYYVGDLEIISEHASLIPGCNFTASSENFTDDRYAIYASIDYNDEQKALFLGRFFDILNRDIVTSDSLLDRAYFAEFGMRPRSQKLEAFFWSMRGEP